jgi:hypothetical protein
VAGLPLLASSTAGAARAGWQAAHVHPEGAALDPVLEHIVQQMASAHNALRRQLKGEHVRAFASQLRTLAVYGRSMDLDVRFRSAAAQLVERDGRDAVLYTEVNRDRIRAELARYGAQPDERLLNRPLTLDYASRSAALNEVLVSGVVVRLERMAAVFERVASEIDRRTGTAVRVRRQDEAYWKAYCESLWSYFQETQFLTALHCAAAALPVIGVAFTPLCMAYTLALLTLGLVYGANCWNVIP